MSGLAKLLAGAALVLVGSAVHAAPGDFAVTNATVVVGDGSAPIQGGTVVVRGGKIVSAGPGGAVPAGVTVIDGTGKWVTPGVVVAMTDLGLLDVGGVDESNDSSADHS